MLLWVPEGTDRDYLVGLPDTVEVGELPSSTRELGEDAHRVEFLIQSWVQDAELLRYQLAQMDSLRVIQTFAAGVEKLAPLIPPGVIFCNGRGLHDSAVAEWCVGAILSVYNKFTGYQRLADICKWSHIETDTLEGGTVTILGYGSIGKAVEKRLQGYDVVVHRVARTSRYDDADHYVHGMTELASTLEQANVLVNLLPLTEETTKLLDAEKLAMLPDGALVINAGRGKTVDTDALISELSNGRLRAVLDVTDPEPIPEDHALWNTPNLLLTQHSSGSSSDYLAKVYPFILSQINRYMAGEPLLNVVKGDY
jgi:phosphoglycerate dehydrogenase-like enzyme